MNVASKGSGAFVIAMLTMAAEQLAMFATLVDNTGIQGKSIQVKILMNVHIRIHIDARTPLNGSNGASRASATRIFTICTGH